MSSDRGGLLKSRAESFARHLQTRLQTLSESQDDSWSEGGDAEVFFDIESPLASPEEEVTEPVFVATQNCNSLTLERTDSEASTYYDSLENVEELKTMSPVGLFNAGNKTVSNVENGSVKNENLMCKINQLSNARHSGSFDSLQLELEASENKTDYVCDINGQEENNNIEQDLVEVNDFIIGLESNSCNVDEIETRQSEDTSTSGVSKDGESNDVYCVFCDIEQIKTDLASECTEVCEISRTSCEGEIDSCQFNRVSEEDLYIPITQTRETDKGKHSRRADHEGDKEINGGEIPQIVVENNASDCLDSDENKSLLNILRELKMEIDQTKESLNEQAETENSAPLEYLSLAIRESPSMTGAKSERKEVDEFDIETRRKHFQRSSSLKTGKTPPGTPGRKKIVRFADVLGLDLADVKTFLDEVPTVPKSAYEDLHYVVDDSSTMEPVPESLPSNTITVVIPQVEKVLTPLFQQPCIQPNFLDRVRQHNLCLENAIVSDMSLFAISGLVRVKNVDFCKSVHVRYTINNWHSFSDLQARYIPKSCDGFSDKFTFTLYGHTLSVGQRLEFAVRFQAGGSQFWDNNGGLNYVFVCNSLQPTNSSALPVVTDDVTAAFY